MDMPVLFVIIAGATIVAIWHFGPRVYHAFSFRSKVRKGLQILQTNLTALEESLGSVGTNLQHLERMCVSEVWKPFRDKAEGISLAHEQRRFDNLLLKKDALRRSKQTFEQVEEVRGAVEYAQEVLDEIQQTVLQQEEGRRKSLDFIRRHVAGIRRDLELKLDDSKVSKLTRGQTEAVIDECKRLVRYSINSKLNWTEVAKRCETVEVGSKRLIQEISRETLRIQDALRRGPALRTGLHQIICITEQKLRRTPSEKARRSLQTAKDLERRAEEQQGALVGNNDQLAMYYLLLMDADDACRNANREHDEVVKDSGLSSNHIGFDNHTNHQHGFVRDDHRSTEQHTDHVVTADSSGSDCSSGVSGD